MSLIKHTKAIKSIAEECKDDIIDRMLGIVHQILSLCQSHSEIKTHAER